MSQSGGKKRKPPDCKSRLPAPATVKGVNHLIAAAGIFLVYNFTRIKWRQIPALEVVAQRPGNVPLMDVDSLSGKLNLQGIKNWTRTTATNLRIRNTWPDRMQLKLKSDGRRLMAI
jgi:hypothetical protein